MNCIACIRYCRGRELTAQLRIVNLCKKLIWGDKQSSVSARNHYTVQCLLSPLMGPGLVSTSPATMSNKDTAKNKKKRGVALALNLRLLARHRHRPASLPKVERASFPRSPMPVATFSTNERSRKRHNWGASEITRPRFSGTCRREPLWAWYHLNFLFSQLPIRARHSSTPLGGIFESRRWTAPTKSETQF